MPLSLTSTSTGGDLRAIGQAIGDRSVVLIGENGHGVSEFTTWKVSLLRYLHAELGFDVVAFESGFHDCREADQRAGTDPPRAVLQRCLIVQLHHTELLPLFEYVRQRRQSSRPLSIAGIDFQIQGYSTRTRPAWYRRELRSAGFERADSLAVLDSVLIEKSFQPTDSLRSWIQQNGATLKALYDSAAAFVTGDVQWSLGGASALVHRELLRLEAMAGGGQLPPSVYEGREDWMARSIERAAGGGGDGHRKIVVWLHNDHARYGEWEAGATRVRAAGQMLRERFGDRVFSIGLLMGSGIFADNFRRARQVAIPDSSGLEDVFQQAGHPVAWLLLNETAQPRVRSWAGNAFSYSRGDARHQMRPGREFDALVYFDSVSSATYLR